MVLDVIGTGSSGNCYLLSADSSSLILDAGIPARKAGGYVHRWSDVDGCLVTHEHQDHAKYWKEFSRLGVQVYMTEETYRSVKQAPELSVKYVRSMEPFTTGKWTVMPFDVEHDAAEPVGYLIRYEPTGETVLYATDTYYLRYTFPKVNYWIVECNYCEDRLEETEVSQRLRGRLIRSHMSLRRLKEALEANDLSKTRAIVLVHMSDERSDETRMVNEIQEVAGINEVYAAAAEDRIKLEETPF